MAVRTSPLIVAALGAALAASFTPGEAAAGPYYKLHPYPASAQGGLGFDTSGEGVVTGLTAMADYRLVHYNGAYTLYGAVRGHALVGPLNGGFGDAHHLAILPAARFELQVASPQVWHPYVVTGLGILHYAGHGNQDGEDATGFGPCAEVAGGISWHVDERWSWYVEASLVAGLPRAAYAGVNGGVQYHFGPRGELPTVY